MPTTDIQYSPDGRIRARLEAFAINLIAYKAIGATATVQEKRESKPWYLFGGTQVDWVGVFVNQITVTNTYTDASCGSVAGRQVRKGCRKKECSCECKEFAVGVNVTMPAAPNSGLPDPASTSVGGMNVPLTIHAVNSFARITLTDGREFLLTVATSF